MWIACESHGRLWKSHVNYWRHENHRWITWEIMEITCESHGRLGKSHVNHMVHDENHMWITWDHMWITWEHMRITCEHMGITCETHVIFMCFFRKGKNGNSFLILPSISVQNFSCIFDALFAIITGMNKILQPCNLCEKTFPESFYHHYSYLALINFYISIYIRYLSTFIFLLVFYI